MSRKVEMPKQGDLKPSPRVFLYGEKGNYVKGTFLKTVKNPVFTDKVSYLLQVEDMQATANLWNKEKEASVDVDVREGDTVFIPETTGLKILMKQVKEGERIKINYLGKGKAKKGQKAPYLVDIDILDDGE